MTFIVTMLKANPILRLVRFIVGFPLIWLGTTVMDQRDSTDVYRKITAMIEEREAEDDVLIGPGRFPLP